MARGKFLNNETLASIGVFIYSALRLNLAMVVTCLPLIILCFGAVSPLRSVPAMLGAGVLSAPGIAAAVCTFRDAPGFRIGLADRLIGATPSDASARHSRTAPVLAGSYWTEADQDQIIRPYFRAYRRLAGRSILVALPTLGLALILGVDAAATMPQAWGALVFPMLLVCACLAVLSFFTTLVLVTELPRARWWPTLRAGLHMTIRRWYLALLSGAVLAVLIAGLIKQPVLTAVLAPSLLMYIVWANAHWSVLPLMHRIEQEEGLAPSAA